MGRIGLGIEFNDDFKADIKNSIIQLIEQQRNIKTMSVSNNIEFSITETINIDSSPERVGRPCFFHWNEVKWPFF